MSRTKDLKEYLINEDDNSGKTIMLSGAWGAGKTHFWQEDILKGKQGLFEQLKDKACVYISLLCKYRYFIKTNQGSGEFTPTRSCSCNRNIKPPM